MEKPKRGEVYQHFKGRFYVVERIIHNTETGEVLVSYYPQDAPDGEGWGRPLEKWIAPAEVDGKPVTRFTRIS